MFKRDPKELRKWPVYFSDGMDFTEVLEITHLKSAFHLYERPFHFDPFPPMLTYSSLAHVLELLLCAKHKNTKAKNDNFLEKRGQP